MGWGPVPHPCPILHLINFDYWETWLKVIMLENFQACFFPIPILFVVSRSEKLIWSEKPPGTSYKSILFQKFHWPFTVWINSFSDLNYFSNSWPSASNFKSFFRSLLLSQMVTTILETKYHLYMYVSRFCDGLDVKI